MPLAKVYVPEGALTAAQRSEIIRGITDVINTTENRPPENRPYTYVMIIELPHDNWGVGGRPYGGGKSP
jgi:4-oxalocrotonate tautomerase family enzyme